MLPESPAVLPRVSLFGIAAQYSIPKAMLATWYLEKSESVIENGSIIMNHEYIAEKSFTLNGDGTWTGEIQWPAGGYVDTGDEPERTWTYEGGLLTFTEYINRQQDAPQ